MHSTVDPRLLHTTTRPVHQRTLVATIPIPTRGLARTTLQRRPHRLHQLPQIHILLRLLPCLLRHQNTLDTGSMPQRLLLHQHRTAVIPRRRVGEERMMVLGMMNRLVHEMVHKRERNGHYDEGLSGGLVNECDYCTIRHPMRC